MSTQTETSLTLTRMIGGEPKAVFKAWTNAQELKKWAAPEGVTVLDTKVDLKVGGRYRIHMRSDDGVDHIAHGTYREIDAPHRLVYTWDWEGENAMGETIVTVEFNDRNGSTEVVLNHEGFPAAEATKHHTSGWESCLNNVEKMFA